MFEVFAFVDTSTLGFYNAFLGKFVPIKTIYAVAARFACLVTNLQTGTGFPRLKVFLVFNFTNFFFC